VVRSDTKDENVSGTHEGFIRSTSQLRNAGKVDGLPWANGQPSGTVRPLYRTGASLLFRERFLYI